MSESFGIAIPGFQQFFHLPANFFRSLCHTIVTVEVKTCLNYSKAVIPVIIFSITGRVCRILPEFYTCILQEKFLLRVLREMNFIQQFFKEKKINTYKKIEKHRRLLHPAIMVIGRRCYGFVTFNVRLLGLQECPIPNCTF